MYGAIAQAGGAAIQGIAATLARKEMDKVFAREMQNQDRYRNESFDKWQKGTQQQGVETARDDIQQGKQRRQDAYTQINETSFGPNEKKTAQGQMSFGLSGDARAGLGGYSDWALNKMVRSIRLQDEMNKISNFSAGDASVFPSLMQDAQQSQDKLAMFGQILSGGGGAASSLGMFNQQGGAFSAPGYMKQIRGVDANQNYNANYEGQV